VKSIRINSRNSVSPNAVLKARPRRPSVYQLGFGYEPVIVVGRTIPSVALNMFTRPFPSG